MGAINIDNTGSGGGITLSSDGTSLLLGGTAIGGSALELYAENPSSPTAQPSATGANAIAIGDSAVASAQDAISIGDGATNAGAFAVSIGWNAAVTSNGTRSIAIGKSATTDGQNSFAAGDSATISSTGISAVALGTSYASGTDSFAAAIATNSSSYGARGDGAVAIGPFAKTSTNTGSVAIGTAAFAHGASGVALGSSYCGGIHGFAAGIANASTSFGATGANSIAMGYQSKATNAYATSIGSSNTVTSNSGHAFGNNNTVSGAGLAIGRFSEVGSNGGMAIGSSAKSDTFFKVAIASGQFSAVGDAQTGISVLRAATTDATATDLNMSNSTRKVILPNNSAYAFHGTIVARQQASGGTACAGWKVEGLIRREGSAGTTVLVNSATTVLDNTPSWGMALSADTTNGGLKIEVTGAASTNIRWVATIHTSEVTYA